MDDHKRKSIFVTGAAGGIGSAVVQKFAHKGWIVGAYDLTEPTFSGELADHPNVITGVLDVTDPDNWERALAEFAEHTGGLIDVLDNNAGVIISGPVAQEKPEDIKKVVDINATAILLGARAVYPYLKRSRGQLLNMSSAAAIAGQPGIAAYCATKFFVQGVTESLRLEWEKDGIRVVDIMPLWAKTPLAQNSAGSVRKLGVHIRPEQVADRVWAAVHPRTGWERATVHYGVSLLDRGLKNISGYIPDRVTRQLVRIMAS